MAPKKGVARVVKSKDKPRKSTQTAASHASKADEDLHLMWLCLKNNGGGQVNYQAVANALGITKSAAKQRFYKFKNHFEGVHSASKNDQDEEMEAEDQLEDEEWDNNSEDAEGDQGMKMEPEEEDA